MRTCVAELVKRFPEGADDDAVWGDEPILNDVSGGFMNVSFTSIGYLRAAGFFITTANKLGLYVYDPQSDKLTPPRVRVSPTGWPSDGRTTDMLLAATILGVSSAIRPAMNDAITRRALLWRLRRRP